MRFEFGEVIAHRNVHRGRIGWIRPARVVHDDERGLLVYIVRGTEVANEVTVDGATARDQPFSEWGRGPHRLEFERWRGPGVLKLHRPGAHHSVWWFHDDDGRFVGWYVNLEAPPMRWHGDRISGVDVVDYDLDVVVAPDRTWRWKDIDELEERLEFPDLYWVDDPEAVWAEGRRVIDEIEAGEYPFDGTWCDFRPDPTWTPLEMPDGATRPPIITAPDAPG